MDRRICRILAMLAFTLVLTACPGPDPEEPEIVTIIDSPTWPEPGDPGEAVVRDFLVVDRNAAGADEALDLLPQFAVEVGLEQTGLINPDLDRQYVDTPAYDTVVAEVAVFQLDGIEIDDALTQLENAGVPAETVAPIHRVTASGHWSAYPGTQPAKVTSDAWDTAATSLEIESPERIVGIVDTGIASGSPNGTAVGPNWHAIDSHNTICDGALHGEAAASAIKQVNPNATVYSANAFPRPDNCWVTNEIDILVATALLQARAQADGFEFDAINFSLGTPAYHSEQSQTRFPPIILRLIMRDTPAVVAAGNSPGDEPIYPAADSTAVHAADDDGKAVVWDSSGMPVPPTTTVTNVAPGCALVLQGVSDGSGGLDTTNVIVWAGSSFASPIFAALGPDAMAGVDPSDMYETAIPPQMNNFGGALYPSAPTDCEGP